MTRTPLARRLYTRLITRTLREPTARAYRLARAANPFRRVGCPPACNEGHTYLWPCEADLGAVDRFTLWVRWMAHNAIAHPLIAVWPSAGWLMHDATLPPGADPGDSFGGAVMDDEPIEERNVAPAGETPLILRGPKPLLDSVRWIDLSPGTPRLAERLIRDGFAAGVPGLADALRALPGNQALPVGEVHISPRPSTFAVPQLVDALIVNAIDQAVETMRTQLEVVGLDPADYIIEVDRTPLDTSVLAEGGDDLAVNEVRLGITARRKPDAGAPWTPEPGTCGADVLGFACTLPAGHDGTHTSTGTTSILRPPYRPEYDPANMADPMDEPTAVLAPHAQALAHAMDRALDLTEPEEDAIAVLDQLGRAGWYLVRNSGPTSAWADAVDEWSTDTRTIGDVLADVPDPLPGVDDRPITAPADPTVAWSPNPPTDLGQLGRWVTTGWVYKADPRDLANTITALLSRLHAETRTLANDLAKETRRLIAAETNDPTHLYDMAAANHDPHDRRLARIIEARRSELVGLPPTLGGRVTGTGWWTLDDLPLDDNPLGENATRIALRDPDGGSWGSWRQLDALPGLRAQLAAGQDAMYPCPECQGRGQVDTSGGAMVPQPDRCPSCHGLGAVPHDAEHVAAIDADQVANADTLESTYEDLTAEHQALATTVAQAITAAHLGRLPSGPEGTHPLLPLAYAIDDALRALVPELDVLIPRVRPDWWEAWVAERLAQDDLAQRVARTSAHAHPGGIDLNITDGEQARAMRDEAVAYEGRRRIADRPQA